MHCSEVRVPGLSLVRWSVMALGLVTTVLLSPPAQAAPAGELGTRPAGEDWPRFLGPSGNNRSSERGLKLDWPATGPKLVWQMRTGVGYGMPTVAHGRLYHFARFGNQARLACFRSETGEQLWQFEYPTDYEDLYGYDNGPRASPIVDQGKVYIIGAEGMLHCLDAEQGTLVWKLDTAQRFGVIQNFFGVGGSPLIEGDLLIANIGGSPAADREVPPGQLNQVHGSGSGVVAFDKRTGEVRYQLSDELASYASPVAATIGDRRWCFVFARGGLVGFDPQTGKLDFHEPWRAPILESVNASTPVVADDMVFISETYGPGSELLRVTPGAAEVEWSDAERRRDKRMQAHWNTPVHHAGYIYGSSGRHTQNAELRCLELKTGKVMWSEAGLTRSSLLYVDEHFICLTEYGELIVLNANPEKFDVVSRLILKDPKSVPGADGEAAHLLKYPCWAAPILSHGLLYVLGHDRFLCFDLAVP